MQPLPAQQISPRIQQVASVYRLGKPQLVYSSPATSSLSRLFGFFALFIGLLILGLFFYLFTSTDLLSSWSVWQIALILLVSAAWLLIGAWITFASFRTRRLSVVVCSDGLIYIKGSVHTMRWEQIKEFWKDIKPGKDAQLTRVYTLRLLDDTSWIFTDDLINVGELGAIVEDEITHHLLPRASAAYLAGKVMYFGTLTLSPWGISVQSGQEEQRALPWGLLQRLHLDDTSLSLYQIGAFWDWVTLPVATIPNVSVLKYLVELVLLEHNPEALSTLIEHYRSGLPVSFGRLQISQRGVDIIDGKITFPWQEIASISVGASEVMLRRKGRPLAWYAIPLSSVSHVPLLKDFLEYVHTTHMPH